MMIVGNRTSTERHSTKTWHKALVLSPAAVRNRYLANKRVIYQSEEHAVYLCTIRQDKKKVILKEAQSVYSHSIRKEVRIYSRLGVQGFTRQLYGYCHNSFGRDCLELEYIPSQDRHFRPQNEYELKQYVAGMLQALWFMHELGVIHRDVKPSNFLVYRGTDGLLDVKNSGFRELIGGCDSLWGK